MVASANKVDSTSHPVACSAVAGCGSDNHLSRGGRQCSGGCARDLLGLLFIRDMVALSPAPLGRRRRCCGSYGRWPVEASSDLEGFVARAGIVVGGWRIRCVSSTPSAGVAGSGARRRARGKPPTRAPQRYVGTSVLLLVVHKAVYGDGASSSSGCWFLLRFRLVLVAGDDRRMRVGVAELSQGPGCDFVVLRGFFAICTGLRVLLDFSVYCVCVLYFVCT